MNKKIMILIMLLLVIPFVYSLPNGSPCTSYTQCDSSYCSSGTCKACSVDTNCITNRYCDPTGKCAACTCTAYFSDNDQKKTGINLYMIPEGKTTYLHANVKCRSSYTYSFKLFEDDTIEGGFYNLVSTIRPSNTELNDLTNSWISTWLSSSSSQIYDTNGQEHYFEVYSSASINKICDTGSRNNPKNMLYACKSVVLPSHCQGYGLSLISYVSGTTFLDCDGNSVPEGACGTGNSIDFDCDQKSDCCKNDKDCDNVEDVYDNCQTVKNSDQLDSDSDGIGDVCDNCKNYKFSTDQTDTDSDGIGDVCDNCKYVNNPGQEGTRLGSNGKTVGDVCWKNQEVNSKCNVHENCLLGNYCLAGGVCGTFDQYCWSIGGCQLDKKIAWLKFENNLDDSLGYHKGIITGNADYENIGAVSNALDINGHSLSLDNFDYSSYNKLSVEMLVKPREAIKVYLKNSDTFQITNLVDVIPAFGWRYLLLTIDKSSGKAKYIIDKNNPVEVSLPNGRSELYISGVGLIDELKLYSDIINSNYDRVCGSGCNTERINERCQENYNCVGGLKCKNNKCMLGDCNQKLDCSSNYKCMTIGTGDNYYGFCMQCENVYGPLGVNDCNACRPSESYDNGISKYCGSIEDCVDTKCVLTNECSSNSNCAIGKECVIQNGIGKCVTIKKVGDNCSVINDCPPNLDCVNGKCYSPYCSTTDDCIDGDVCISGRCETPLCTRDDQCIGKICDALFYTCVDGTKIQCSSGVSCGSGKRCENNVCVVDFCYNNNCQTVSKVCNPKNGQCENSCTKNDDCGSGKECQNNICVDIVTLPPDGGGCVSDVECGNGKKCESNVCVTSQTTGAPIGGGQTVNIDSNCGTGIHCTSPNTCVNEPPTYVKLVDSCCGGNCLESFVTTTGISLTTSRGECKVEPGQTEGYRIVKVCTQLDPNGDCTTETTDPTAYGSLGLDSGSYREECTILPNDVQTYVPFFDLFNMLILLGLICVYYVFREK